MPAATQRQRDSHPERSELIRAFGRPSYNNAKVLGSILPHRVARGEVRPLPGAYLSHRPAGVP